MCSVRLANCSNPAHRGRNLCTGAVVKPHIWHKSCSAWVRIQGIRLSDEKHLSSTTDDYPLYLELFFFSPLMLFGSLIASSQSHPFSFCLERGDAKGVTRNYAPVWCGSFYRFLLQWQTIYITPTYQADVPMSLKWISIYVSVVMFITDMLDMCAFTMTCWLLENWLWFVLLI